MKFLKTIIILCAFFLALPVSAAQLFLSSEGSQIARQQYMMVKVVLDAEGQNINAVEGTIVVSSGVKISSISDSNSLVSNWATYPKQEGSHLQFSGIIPGGYHGKQGLLFSFLIQAIDVVPTISMNLTNARVLLNDGRGTPATLSTGDITLQVNPNIQYGSPLQKLFEGDTTAPEQFRPELGRSPDLFDNHWFIAFTTQDKQSGIDHYELQETQNGYLDPRKWQRVTSPYELQDQSLTSSIHIRAYDLAGNVVEVTVGPLRARQWYENSLLYIILIVSIIIVSWTQYKKKKR